MVSVESADRARRPVPVALLEPKESEVFVEVPELILSPYVISKIEYLFTLSSCEIGGFFIAELGDPLTITDFKIIKQLSTAVTNSFDDDDVLDYFLEMHERKMQPGSFCRIWAHTHPMGSAMPSALDESTFATKFCARGVPGCSQPWAGMFIRSRSGENYFRLAFNPADGPTMQVAASISIGLNLPNLHEADEASWRHEFDTCVTVDGSASRVFTYDGKVGRRCDLSKPYDGIEILESEYDMATYDDDGYEIGSNELRHLSRDIKADHGHATDDEELQYLEDDLEDRRDEYDCLLSEDEIDQILDESEEVLALD